MRPIEEVPVPVPGVTYLVPTIEGSPVVGTPHVDHDHFQCTEDHWHLDGRFVGPGQQRVAIRNKGQTPRWEPHVCLHAAPPLWPQGNYADDYVNRNAVGMATMALYLGHHRRKAICGICPHKGMPIQDGICSGHRLKWLADGTIAHKPPYTIQIRGTENKLVLTDLPEGCKIDISVTHEHHGSVVLDMYDCDGVLVAWHDTGIAYVNKGDVIKMHPTPGCKA